MGDCKELDILSVSTTVGSLEDARRLARVLVEQRLAACVQIDPEVRSFYRWQGSIHDDAEVRLVIKSVPDCLVALQRFLAQQHPYEVPEFVATRMTASPGYAAWVRGEITVPAG